MQWHSLPLTKQSYKSLITNLTEHFHSPLFNNGFLRPFCWSYYFHLFTLYVVSYSRQQILSSSMAKAWKSKLGRILESGEGEGMQTQTILLIYQKKTLAKSPCGKWKGWIILSAGGGPHPGLQCSRLHCTLVVHLYIKSAPWSVMFLLFC